MFLVQARYQIRVRETRRPEQALLINKRRAFQQEINAF